MNEGELMKSQALITNAIAAASLTAVSLLLPRVAELREKNGSPSKSIVGGVCISVLISCFFTSFATSYFYSVAVGHYFSPPRTDPNSNRKPDSPQERIAEGSKVQHPPGAGNAADRKGAVLLCLPVLIFASLGVTLVTGVSQLLFFFGYHDVYLIMDRLFIVVSAMVLVGYAGTLSDAVAFEEDGSPAWHGTLFAVGAVVCGGLYAGYTWQAGPLDDHRTGWKALRPRRLMRWLFQRYERMHDVRGPSNKMNVYVLLSMCGVVAVGEEVIFQGEYYERLHPAIAILLISYLAWLISTSRRSLEIVRRLTDESEKVEAKPA